MGGSERYYFDLTRLLASRGHRVIPFSMLDSQNQDTPYSDYFVSHIDYKNSSFRYLLRNSAKIVGKTLYSFESKHKIEKLIQSTRPEIAHIHMISHHISPSILYILKKYGIPMVQTLHEYKLICPNYKLYIERKGETCERCRGKKFYNAFFHRCLRDSLSGSFLACFAMFIHEFFKMYKNNIDAFIVPSQFSKRKMIEFGVDNKKLVFLPYMIDTENFKPNYSHSNYILYFGRLAKEKGVLTLVKAMSNFRDTQLYVVGTGELEEELNKFVEKKGMENVKFMGHKTGEALKSLIRKAQFVVVPSEWYEVFGLTVAEGFACGKPVIGSDAGGIAELITEETGLLFQPGNSDDLSDKIEYFLTHPSLLKGLGMQARKFVEENFAPSDHYEKIMSIYCGLLDGA